MSNLNQSTIEKLGYYVYLLKNPTNGDIFYVGKGKGNRINFHELEKLVVAEKRTDKHKIIEQIKQRGGKVEKYILRHGLTEQEALIVEASAIDLLKLDTLTNVVRGQQSREKGLTSIEEIELLYQAQPAIFDNGRNLLLVKLNKTWADNISPEDLYTATRRSWKIARHKAVKIDYVCAVHNGIIREVYKPERWYKSTDKAHPDRLEFEGGIADNKIRKLYIKKSVAGLWKRGHISPTIYIWAK